MATSTEVGCVGVPMVAVGHGTENSPNPPRLTAARAPGRMPRRETLSAAREAGTWVEKRRRVGYTAKPGGGRRSLPWGPPTLSGAAGACRVRGAATSPQSQAQEAKEASCGAAKTALSMTMPRHGVAGEHGHPPHVLHPGVVAHW
eukprot:scaffold47238_cov72-Phaeocystis_antarctica.AAC.2